MTIEKNTNNFLQPFQICCTEKEQKIGGNLSIYVLKLLPKVSTLPNLVAISIAKVEILVFYIVAWRQIGHLIKESVVI